MLELTEIIYNGLVSVSAVTTVFGNKIYPLLADEKVAEPFVAYKVRQLGRTSKDGINEFEVIVNNYDNTYDTALTNAAVLNDAMISLQHAGKQYHFKEVSKDPLLTEDQKVYVEQVYSIKI